MLRALEDKLPIDQIFFSDTEMEFPEMYKYIEKVEGFIKRKYNVEVHHFKPADGKGYKEFSRGGGVIREKEQVRGIPRQLEPCWLQRNAKVRPFEIWLRDNKIKDHLIYIGYTADELRRAKLKAMKNNDAKIVDNNQLYPLILWGVSSNQVKLELQKMGMLNPLYEHFDRTGCFMCPKVNESTYYMLWKYYPKQWKWMKKEEKKLRKLGNVFNTSFNKDSTLKQMEKKFESKGYDVTLRTVNEQDFCFCVI
jgi:3'-phosphoadenosine 5'-phosphosulfate sulfotransferase (PAPS reductase)/FAD synthetase